MKHIVIFLLVTCLLIAILGALFPMEHFSSDTAGALLQLLAVGALVSSGIVYHYRANASKAVLHALIWLCLGLVIALLYTGRDRFAALLPGAAQTDSAGALTLTAATDGHFYLNTTINGEKVQFMIDTGASTLLLTQTAARHAGLNPESLAYTQPFTTANGKVFAAPVTLESIEIAGHIFTEVPAYVSQGDQDTPLMGMRFLDRAQSVELRKDRLTIRF